MTLSEERDGIVLERYYLDGYPESRVWMTLLSDARWEAERPVLVDC